MFILKAKFLFQNRFMVLFGSIDVTLFKLHNRVIIEKKKLFGGLMSGTPDL